MRTKLSTRRVWAVSVQRKAIVVPLLVAILTIAAVPAAAQTEGDGPERVETTIAADAIMDASVSGEEAAATPEGRRFLEEQARRGALLDARAIKVAEVRADDENVTIVSELGADVQAVGVVQDGRSSGVGTIVSQDDDESGPGALPPGMGMAAFQNASGGSRISGSCTSVIANGDRATSCYEKWKIQSDNGFDRWAYNRWGTGDPGDGNWITEVTIRSRPWNGTQGRLRQFNDFWPRSGGNVCGGSGSAGFGGFGFSATIPIQNCSISDIQPNAAEFSMASKWLAGNVAPRYTKAVDFALILSTAAGQSLVMADYIWSSYGHGFQGCRTCYTTVWRDSGWAR